MGFKVWFPEIYDKKRAMPIFFAMIDDTDGHTVEIPAGYNIGVYIEDENGNVLLNDTVPITAFFFNHKYVMTYVISEGLLTDNVVIGVTIYDDIMLGSVWYFQIEAYDYRLLSRETGRFLVNQDWGDQTTPDNWAGGWINKDGITAIRDVLVYAVDESGAITDSAYSDENGNWSLSLRPGNYVIKFRKYGYTFLDRQVIVE